MLHDRPFVLLPKKDHLIRLDSEFHLLLLWWHQFLSQWHGVSFWLFPGLLPAAEVEADSAGSLGYGTFFERFWFTGSFLGLLLSSSSSQLPTKNFSQ